MATWKMSFAGWDFPTTQTEFHPVSIQGDTDNAIADVARRSGAATQKPRSRATQISIVGGWGASSLDDWNATRDTVLGKVIGKVGDLYVARSDFFFRDAQLENWSQGTQADGRLWAILGTLQLNFIAARFPEMFDSASNAPTLTASGGTINYSASQGNSDTWPTWTIVIDTGAAGEITLANAATGESCKIKKPTGTFANGDEIVLCGLPGARIATLNGTETPGLFDRRIPRLTAGNNVITCSATGSLTVDTLAVTYPGRWK